MSCSICDKHSKKDKPYFHDSNVCPKCFRELQEEVKDLREQFMKLYYEHHAMVGKPSSK